MSFEEYTKWWAAAKSDLEKLIKSEPKIIKKLTKIPDDLKLAYHLIGGLYAKYCIAVQNLGLIMDQMAQPQKRETVKKILDAAVIRLSELNKELLKIDLSEIHYVDGALIELKIIPHTVEILDPFFYFTRYYTIEEMWKKLRVGETIFIPPEPARPEQVHLDKSELQVVTVKHSGASIVKSTSKSISVNQMELKKKRSTKFVTPVMTPEEKAAMEHKLHMDELALIIQRNERGRQDRLFYLDKACFNRLRETEVDDKDIITDSLKGLEESAAANRIQAVWRGIQERQLIRKKEAERRLLIGMTIPSYRSKKEFEKLDETYEKRRDYRDQRIKEFEEAKIKEKEYIYRVRAPGLMEDISDEIREWMHNFYEKTKNFDRIPPPKLGGSILIVRGETMTPEEWLQNKQRKQKPVDQKALKLKEKQQAKKKKAELKKKKMQEKKRKKKAEANRRKLRMKGEFELGLDDSMVDPLYKEAFKEYIDLWIERKDEDNPLEKHYMDMIQEQFHYELQLELRPIVDQMMWIELQLLNKALMKDTRKKWKFKIPKPVKPKKKKGRKDLTSKRTTEDLFQELYNHGIIKDYSRNHKLDDFKGDFSYKNWELTCLSLNPTPCVGDVRQAIKVNCILPLSVTRMKKPKSVLILGHRQSGKHILANAIFSETRCMLFDLSPENTAGKFEGKKAMKMLLHLIQKMSKILQPSIIFVDKVERLFYKKVPAEDSWMSPKRLGGMMKKIVKPIKPEDKVLVLGTCGRPWMAAAGKMKKVFEKTILIPRVDYNTCFLYWTELLMAYHAVDRNFDISAIAKQTVNYPIGVIKRICEEVMSPRRIIRLSYEPLKQQELFEPFITELPVDDKEWKKYIKFMMKYRTEKDRSKIAEFIKKKMQMEQEKATKKK